MKRPSRSLQTQRDMSGDCVEWKPEMAPQAMVMNISGHMGSCLGCRLARVRLGNML